MRREVATVAGIVVRSHIASPYGRCRVCTEPWPCPRLREVTEQDTPSVRVAS